MIEPSRQLTPQELNVLMRDPKLAAYAKEAEIRAEASKAAELRQKLLPAPKTQAASPQ